MSVVATQALPSSAKGADLDNVKTWLRSTSSARPSLQPWKLSPHHNLLVNGDRSAKKNFEIVIVTSPEQLENQPLFDRHVAAFITQDGPSHRIAQQGIIDGIQQAGIIPIQGLIVLRLGGKRGLEKLGDGGIDVEVEDEVLLEHILTLLGRLGDTPK